MSEQTPSRACSFCGESATKVTKMFHGKEASICGSCTLLHLEMLHYTGHIDVSALSKHWNTTAEAWASLTDPGKSS